VVQTVRNTNAADTATDTVREAAAALQRDGCVVLADVVPPDLHERLAAAFESRHRRHIRERPRDALLVGDRRFMLSLRLRPPFTDAGLLANPVVMTVLRASLGDDACLFSVGAVVSQPGSQDQHVHSDIGPGLFGDESVETGLPPYGITVIVPLVDMNAETGSTRVWPGTHRMPLAQLHDVTPEDPVVPRGSALLFDYRLQHGGVGNRSGRVRPILSLVYGRPWFRDPLNFTRQAPLLLDPLTRVRMPRESAAVLPAPSRPPSPVVRRAGRAVRRLTRR
jgi:Phytanoyl-CoA dioxygenase (PhyH)